MLDIKWIRENPEALTRALTHRGVDPDEAETQVGDLVSLDEARRTHIVKLEEAQARRNAASKAIGAAMAKGDQAEADKLKAEVGELKTFLQNAEDEGRKLDKALEDALAIVPNVPLDDVPVGPDEHANAHLRSWGTRPGLNAAREHYELGEALGGMDFETAAKLSGSRFVVLSGKLARLERALGQFMLDLHTEEHGYTEVLPPLLVRDDALFGTGQLPKFAEDQFVARQIDDEKLRADVARWVGEVAEASVQSLNLANRDDEIPANWTADAFLSQNPSLYRERAEYLTKQVKGEAESEFLSNYWLIPTAEVPLTNLVRESIRDEAELPLRVTALTPCFRSEAGAAGKDTRGMLRQHQFDKVELVSITTPETSGDEHERMLACAEEVLRRLDLHYRVMTLSTGDMGFAAQKTWDIEVWLPGQGTYREISSCSVCGDFQARRMQARYRPTEGKGTRLVHTLNGSGVAVGRAVIAVMENYQNGDGSVTVPDALRPYMNGLEKIEA